MASRRFRIKPVANLAVRRGKVNSENERSETTSGAETPLVENGEAPKSNEPALPSEETGNGDNISALPSEEAGDGDISPKLSSPQVNIKQRSRFLKPAPRIVGGIRGLRKPDEISMVQKPLSPDPVVPHIVSELILPEITSESKQGTINSINSGGESEEDSRALSEASTITPPGKKLSEVSRPRFVKPTPRLVEASARRNSIQGSASESEDENRRSLSIASTITPPNKRHSDLASEEPPDKIRKDDVFDLPEKKTNRNRRTPNSGTVRLAKARMEFHNKFGNRTPDRSRLTMFDLIFYNPTTNPMKSSGQEITKSAKPVNLGGDEEIIEERLNEEQVDEPSAPDDTQNVNDANQEEEEEEDDMAMPVPQVKVGPDGQIILDEKSLVIETTGTKKGREDLANSAVVVDYGNGSTGYGTYRRKNKKYRDWSTEETLKFYRALHTVGTDFSLMQTLFPKRTRQDLKAKYKKEDRINRYLVEKALLHPLDFDLTELEKDLEREEQEARERAVRQLQLAPHPPKAPVKRRNKKTESFLMRSMNSEDRGEKRGRNSRPKKRKLDNKTNIKRNALILKQKDDESDESELDFNLEDDCRFNIAVDDPKADHDTSDCETAEIEYLKKPPKPTRSGRLPQPRKQAELEDAENMFSSRKKKETNVVKSSLKNVDCQSMSVQDLTNEESRTSSESPVNHGTPTRDAGNQPTMSETPENFTVTLDNLANVEPGSLVVVATESPTNPGHQVYKVFMVTPNPGGAVAPVSVPLSSPLLNSMSGICPNIQT